MVYDNVCGSYAMFVVVLIIAKSFDCVMFNILLQINIFIYVSVSAMY